MGSKHPQETLKLLGAGKCEFIIAARHLIRQGIVKSPVEAIRFMEENNCNVDDIIDQFIVNKQAKILVKESDDNNE